MATAVEEPDLFNGLEITEMDDINMESSDEYVFIPSDNENEDENGSSLASQSVFHPPPPPVVAASNSESQSVVVQGGPVYEMKTTAAAETVATEVSGVERMDTEGDQLLASFGLDEALLRAAEEARLRDGEVIIVKRIDLTEEDESPVNGEDNSQRFAVSYDFNLDMQQLLNNIEQGEEIPAEVTIKEEIDIEEAVVNLPVEEETGLSESQLELIHHDEHVLGSEVITLDSDAEESEEDEEDCIMMSLLEQFPVTIKEEGPDEDRTHVENDHPYTSPPAAEGQTTPDTAGSPKPDSTLQALVDLSKRVLEEFGASGSELDETLKSITSLEEQLRSFRERLLHNEQSSERMEEGISEAPTPPTVEEPTNEAATAPAAEEPTNEVVVAAAPTAEEPTDEAAAASTAEEPTDEAAVPPTAEEPTDEATAPPTAEEPTDAPAPPKESSDTDTLSVELSDNCSERLECTSVTDLAVLGSDVAEKESGEIVSQQEEAADTSSATTTDETEQEQQLEKQHTSNLSKNLSPNVSEPLEHEADQPKELEEAKDTQDDESMETEQESTVHPEQATEDDGEGDEKEKEPSENASSAMEEAPPAEEDAPPAVEEAAPALEDAPPSEEEAPPVEEEPRPVEENAPPAEEQAQPADEEAQLAEGEAQPAEEEAQPADKEAQPADEETHPAEEEAQPKEKEVQQTSAAEGTNQPGLNIKSMEDLFAYGELFTKECEIWLDKINNNCRQTEGNEGDAQETDKEEVLKAERFMASLTKEVQRLALKVSSKEESQPRRSVEVAIQTEKVQRSRAQAKALNEKYKKRLLSSLAETQEAEEQGSSAEESEVESDGSNNDAGDARSSEAAESDAEDNADDDDEEDEAFERRQIQRRTKRLRQQMANEASAESKDDRSEDEDDEDEVHPSKKRSVRRLGSTDSSIVDKGDGDGAGLDDSEEIAVKNEPYVDSESSSTKGVRSKISNADDSIEPMEDEEEAVSIKQESSITLNASQGQSESMQEKLTEETDESSKERREDDGGDEQSDSELLDDVLGQVDDILLDVNDILPAAEGVVQDYLVEEEVRTEQEEGRRDSKREEIKRKPKSSGKKIDSEEEDEAGSDREGKVKEKAIEDMTESELEDYYDNQREKEIDKLCNLANLEVARNANPQKQQDVRKKPVVAKKKERVMDEIFNDVDLHHESDDSDSDTEVVETEELFLQKCNENMKNQLLNQLSSSDTEQDSGSEDSIAEALKQEGEYDSDDSAGSILMEKFLKSLDKNHDLSGDEGDAKEGEADQEDEEKLGDDADSSVQTDTGEADKSGEKSEKDFIDDSDLLEEGDNEEAMEKMKQKLSSTDRKKSEDEEEKTSKEKEKSKDRPVSGSSKTAAIDPIDKQLFSKKMFREVDETLRKDRERDLLDKENGSLADRSDRIGSDDSDVELLDVSMFQPKRKMKERKLEDFDFSSSSKRSEQQKKRGSGKDDDCISLSSESEAEVEETGATDGDGKENKTRKIRTMLTQDQLADETKTAQKDEEIRLSRLRKKNENLKKFLVTFKPGPEESDLVLDYDSKLSKAICVHPDIVKLLKPHQKEGVRFMYDNTYGSIEYANKNPGSGCILAHCMGLGKTLQLITLLHTVMRYPQLRTKRVLVICPKSTVMNWSDEIQQWLGSLKSGPRLKVFYFPDNSDVNDKLKVLSDWYASTANRCGCMLIGYEAFRILVNYEKRKRTPSNILAAKAAFVKKKVDEYLLDPGADLVICDEGHQIKNKKSAISGAVSQIKTKRRIVLTGTPIQNNLKEYYCMVNFIKPSFLGSDREFSNLYSNPIKNGQHKDSDSRAIKIMKQRSYVLHNKLSRFVQRREAGVLKEFLPEKFEYVLFVPLTPVQEKMYEVFLQMNEYVTATGEAVEAAKGKKFKLLADYTSLRKIWTHPKVLEKAWETAVQEKNKRDARFRLTSTPDSDEDRPDDYNDITSGALSVTNDWWRKHLEANDLESIYPSGKLRIMFEILKQCHERGEKCLIFSAFVAVLNVVEHFMRKIHNRENDKMADVYGYSAFKGPWEPGKDYYRLDGKTQKNLRHRMITSFNDPSNKRTKCFLISAKAGGQGINLIGANRVIILDTSWNPSNDQQNIFRIFRLGQKRKCFVYRLLAMGTMEEKVYSRSVTKQAMSFRVVDEQQIDRHYSFSELAELYNLSKVADQVREMPILPADDLLASLLRNYPDCAFKYHEHDSLLENKPEQDLSEEDKREAWAAYEREIQNNEKPAYPGNLGMLPNFMSSMFPGAPGSGIGPYPPPINYSGLPGTLADMYRSDFGYGSGINRLMYPYGSSSYPMANDPSYSSIMGKSPYPNFNLPGSSGSIPDFGMTSAMNGQGSPSSNYNSTVALQSLLDLYAKSMSNAMSSSTITTATATSVSPITSTSSAGVSSPYSALNSLKQFNGFPAISPISTPMPHSSPQIPPAKTSQSPSSSSGNAALINMLNEQPMPMSSAASSGPFSHLNSPLPAPSIHVPRNIPTAVTTTSSTSSSSPVLSTSPVAKAIAPPSSAAALTVPPSSSTRPSAYKPPESPVKPVALTTTVVASDDDDVDDDGIPRPHIIVRDPTSINASSTKAQQEQEKIVKKINMGIVYPKEKKKDQSKDIMLSAKSITNLVKPTIAVKNVESMKAVPRKTPMPVMTRPGGGSLGNKSIRVSPILQNPMTTLPKPPHPGSSRQSSPLTRTPLSSSSPVLGMKHSPTPRQQQVPVITSAKSLQLSSPNLAGMGAGNFSTQSPRTPASSASSSKTSSASPTPTSSAAIPRGAIAAQQLRELQQRLNQANNASSTGNLTVARTKKAATQQASSSQRLTTTNTKPGGAHPIGIFASPTTSASNVLTSQKPTSKATITPSSTSSPTAATTTTGGRTGKSSLSDSVSITKITGAGHRIPMGNNAPSSISNTKSTGSSLATMSPSSSMALGRKQDLVITKTTPGTATTAATVRKMLPSGSNMVVKAHSGGLTTAAGQAKRTFPSSITSTLKSGATPGSAQLIPSTSVGVSLPSGITTGNSITVRKRKATEPTLIDSLKAKNNSITISEVRSIYQPPAAKKPNQSLPMPAAPKRFGSGITITPRKPPPQQQQQNVLEVVEIE